MTVFWLVAALFIAGALLMLLPALLAPRAATVSAAGANVAVHRHQWREVEQDIAAGLIAPDRADEARAEIEQRVLEDGAAVDAAQPPRPARFTALALLLLLPAASLGLYAWLGHPPTAEPAAAPAGADRHALTPEQIQQRVAALAERLKAQPGDAEGWLMLGRSYTALGRFRDAATAMRRASDLMPQDPNVLADLADLVAMAQNKRLAGEPARLVQRALDLDPRHVKALALAGSVAFEARDWQAARGYWERLVAVLPPDSPMLRGVQGSILEATQMQNGGGATAAAAPAVASAAAQVSGEVSLSPELASQLQPGDTLFVFARAAQGPRMPLAVIRRPVGTLPFAFTLDDSMAMAPNLRLSGFKEVVIGARISRNGSATPQSGDLVGLSAPLAPGATGVRVVIDQRQP